MLSVSVLGMGFTITTYVDEHGLAKLFNQAFDLYGIEICFFLSWRCHGESFAILLKPTDIFQVVFEVVHCLDKCGVLLDRWGGEFGF